MPSSQPDSRPHRPPGNLRVIVLDDSAFDREHLCRICRRLGVAPDLVRTVAEFSDRIAERSYDLAIIDYLLGADTGEAALDLMARRGLGTARVLLTGIDDPRVVERAIALGCTACMRKDRFDFTALAEIVDALRPGPPVARGQMQ